MLIKFTIRFLLFSAMFWCGFTFADEDINTSTATGGDQIIVSPMSTMLDVTDTVSVNVLILDEDGNPIEGHKVRIVPQDSKIVSVNISSSVSDESGYISFYIFCTGRDYTNAKLQCLPVSLVSRLEAYLD